MRIAHTPAIHATARHPLLFLAVLLVGTLASAWGWDRPLSPSQEMRVKEILRESEDLTWSDRETLKKVLRGDPIEDADRTRLRRMELEYQDQEEKEDIGHEK